MYEYREGSQDNQSRAVANFVSQKKDSSQLSSIFVDNREVFSFSDNRTGASQRLQRKMQTTCDSNSPSQPIQKKENKTGLPDNLKTGIENLSGYSMDDVKVHYNSSKPAQLQAHAYAQGTDIHVASGQEKHLPHEAWHVVQQKQERVKPTMEMKRKVNINDDTGLEEEADVRRKESMRSSRVTSMQRKIQEYQPLSHSENVIQRELSEDDISNLIAPLTALFADNNQNNIPRIIDNIFSTATGSPTMEDLLLANLGRLGTIFSALDPKVKMALDFFQTLGIKLNALEEQIWGAAYKNHLFNGIRSSLGTGTNDVEISEAHQINNNLPEIEWDPSRFLSYAQILTTVKGSDSLDDKLETSELMTDRVRIALLNPYYSAPEDLEVSDMPDAGDLSGVINKDVNAFDVDPLPEEMRIYFKTYAPNKIEEYNETRRQSTKSLKKGTRVSINKVQGEVGILKIITNKITLYVYERDIDKESEPELKLLSDIYDGVPIFNQTGPDPEDISQGALGDCYALAALASIAKQQPRVITDMVKETAANTVAVRFFDKAGDPPKFTPEWTKVDKEVYVDQETQQPIYAKGNKALWPALVEKAYAVFIGKAKGYEGIGGGGYSHDTFEQVLGQPATKTEIPKNIQEGALGSKIYSQKAEDLFTQIKGSIDNGKVVALGTKEWGVGGTGKSGGENTEDVPGLASTHAYSVLATSVSKGHKYLNI
ncbi:MAG: DUF4157 domain-containing protein, partial [Proteobacteria bacterium]|nr:DUF4157 domain-containing protein [Pseudomonadota bacterium]